jgi:uncharacterized YccA/Bax inhibitor family protein
MEEILHKLNRTKIFLIVVLLTAYVYIMIQWLYPMMNQKSTASNMIGALGSLALVLLLTYIIPKIVNFSKTQN